MYAHMLEPRLSSQTLEPTSWGIPSDASYRVRLTPPSCVCESHTLIRHDNSHASRTSRLRAAPRCARPDAYPLVLLLISRLACSRTEYRRVRVGQNAITTDPPTRALLCSIMRLHCTVVTHGYRPKHSLRLPLAPVIKAVRIPSGAFPNSSAPCSHTHSTVHAPQTNGPSMRLLQSRLPA